MNRNVSGILMTMLILAFALLSGCGKMASESALSDPNRNLAGTTSGFPGVVLVVVPRGSGICTGTIIGPRAVLTAAHCTKASGRYTVQADFGNGIETFGTSTVENFGPGVVDDPNDISLLIFDSDLSPAGSKNIYGIASSLVRGDTVDLIGFGCNNLETRSGAGVKRAGQNQVAQVSDYLYFETPMSFSSVSRNILGPANRSASCFGDSGGPALTVSNGQYVVSGVTHAGGSTSTTYISLYSDVANRSDNKGFLQSINSRYGLGISGL